LNKAITHPELLHFAEAVGERMANEYINRGDYFPSEAWGCEGQIYPSLMGIALLRLYEVTRKEIYLEGVKSLIHSIVRKQKESGGWALSLGFTGNGIEFEASPEMIKLTDEVEDLPPTVTALRLMSEYQQVTGDSRYNQTLVKGFEYLKGYWNEGKGAFDEMLTGEALKLRASPRDYHIYAFQSVYSLKAIFPEAKKFVKPLYHSVKSNFELMTGDTYPLLYAMHASLIMQHEGNSEYVSSYVIEKIEGELVFNSRFLITDAPGAFGHRDGLRGICLDEGHLRNAIGAALALSFYDKYIEPDKFTTTSMYSEVTSWIQSMYEEGKYFEFIDFESGEKRGVGSPGQFLPIFWILGQF
jgi:hypothetical protein